jgi:hypothetical protein
MLISRIIQKFLYAPDDVDASDSFAFPDGHGLPSEGFQFGDIPNIASSVRIKLVLPKFRAGFWCGCATAAHMPMPKTPVYEYHGLSCWKDNIGGTGQITPVQPKAISKRM